MLLPRSEVIARARAEIRARLGITCDKELIHSPIKGPKYATLLKQMMNEVQYNRLTRTTLYPHQQRIFEPPFEPLIAVLAGNRSGKSMAAAYACACHATGIYPDWWQDVRYTSAPTIYIGGETTDQLKAAMQEALFGTSDRRDLDAVGTGLIPRNNIVLESIVANNSPDGIRNCRIRHESGGHSKLVFFTYNAAREALQGGAIDCVFFDEQPPEDVVAEILRGIAITPTGQRATVMFSFTPLLGRTATVAKFLAKAPGTKCIQFGWDDVPLELLPQQSRDVLIGQWPEYELEARVHGRPAVGQGRVFAINLRTSVTYNPQDVTIKDNWYRCVGIDPGRSPDPCAIVWCAWDKDADIIYIYDCLKLYNMTPVEFVPHILARGKEWPIILPRDAKRQGYTETSSLRDELTYKYHLNVMPEPFTNPDNNSIGIDYGVQYMLQRMRTGRFKINRELEDLLIELENYHTDRLLSGKLEFKGEIHAGDAARYATLSVERFGLSKLQIGVPNTYQHMQDLQYLQKYDENRYN